MTRRLLNLLTLLSLLLCMAVAGLWVRSYFASDNLLRYTLTAGPLGYRSGEYSLSTWRGVLSVGIIRHEFTRSAMPANEYEIDLQIARSIHAEAARGRWTSRSPDEFRATNGGPLSRFGFLGWRLNERGTGHRGVGIGWSTPYWFLVLLCCPAPSLRLTARLRNRRRRGRGLCPACGYDLRGTPDRCPECGRAVALPSRS